ncbi:DegT/DnrJ/EryC1/StrS family aminotransferase [Aquirufa sp. ROCK2-A2]
MLHVTKSFLPDISIYSKYLQRIWETSHLTNDGPLLKELEAKLAEFLEVENFIFVTNGTIALQLAIKALNLTGEIITTPFSYCATSNSIIWENCQPIFADVNPQSLTVESSNIKSIISPKTEAILTTHVYGNAGDLELQEEIAHEYQIPLIFDGAHAFGVKYKGKSIFNYGDVSTCSFHATKIFHTVEGGAVMTNNSKLAAKIKELRSFGHKGDEYFSAGINGKNSEFHAAMGLANLEEFEKIKSHRKWASSVYDQHLVSPIFKYDYNPNIDRNYSYYPILLPSEDYLFKIVAELNQHQIFPRRYFYPSLNTLSFINYQACPISEDFSKRILCLPLSAAITESEILKVCQVLNNS